MTDKKLSDMFEAAWAATAKAGPIRVGPDPTNGNPWRRGFPAPGLVPGIRRPGLPSVSANYRTPEQETHSAAIGGR